MKKTKLPKKSKRKRYPQYKKAQEKSKVITNEVPLGTRDRITYIWKVNKSNKVIEVTSVSYNILIKDKWVTIVYYDSSHSGILHRHERISLLDESDTPTTDNVRKKGSQKKLLTWAVEDIKRNFIDYKRRFIKRCRKLDKEPIDIG